jgi:glycosyltransferase involved in cell wall biosynthesis
VSAAAPAISVVICVYTEERWSDIVAAVASVAVQRVPPLETIVVVDHNPDLGRRVRKELPSVRVVDNDGSRGLSDARNGGVRAARGETIAFLDDDARADPGWTKAMLAGYADPAVAGVGGTARPIWQTGSRPHWMPEEFDWVVGCSYRGQPTHPARVRNFLGCNMSFRREAFDAAGRFDTAVGRVGTRPVGGEETEFCIRLQRAWPSAILLYDPAVAVSHAVPASRARWGYFLSRCYSEGLSKAIVSRLAGADAGLASERRYVAATLPLGALRHLGHVFTRRDPAGLARAGAIVVGLAVTTAGYLVGRVRGRSASGASEAATPSVE